jgi:hypothetical protein
MKMMSASESVYHEVNMNPQDLCFFGVRQYVLYCCTYSNRQELSTQLGHWIGSSLTGWLRHGRIIELQWIAPAAELVVRELVAAGAKETTGQPGA